MSESNQVVMKAVIKEEDDDDDKEIEDQFCRLPNEILLSIFDKVADAKSLCKCLLVSKRFFSVVPSTRTVFLQVPNWKPIPERLISYRRHQNYIPRRPYLAFLHTIYYFFVCCFCIIVDVCFVIRLIFSLLTSISSLSFTHTALHIFNSILSLQIQLLRPKRYLDESNSWTTHIKWNAEFKTYRKRNFVIIFVKSITEGNGGEEEGEDGQELSIEDYELRLSIALFHLMDAWMRFHVTRMCLRFFPLLEEVYISDSENQGKVYIGKEDIRELGNPSGDSFLMGRMKWEYLKIQGRVWHTPILRLASSEVVMKDVTLVVVRSVDRNMNRNDEFDADLSVKGAFGPEGEENHFSQAATELLKRNPNHSNFADFIS